MLNSRAMGYPTERSEEPKPDFTARTYRVFGAGLLAYVLGFVYLAHNMPDVAPAVIVAGILCMLCAFLI